MLLGCEVEVTIVPRSGFPVRLSENEDVDVLALERPGGVGVDVDMEDGEMRLLEPGEEPVLFGEPMVVDGGSVPGLIRDGEVETDGEDVDVGTGEPLTDVTAVVDVKNPARKPGRKPGKPEKQAIGVTLVHGDVLVLSGDVFKVGSQRSSSLRWLMCC